MNIKNQVPVVLIKMKNQFVSNTEVLSKLRYGESKLLVIHVAPITAPNTQHITYTRKTISMFLLVSYSSLDFLVLELAEFIITLVS